MVEEVAAEVEMEVASPFLKECVCVCERERERERKSEGGREVTGDSL